MKHFLLRWLVNFLGLWTAATLIAGIDYGPRLRVVLWAALVFSIINALVRPLIILLSLPAIVLTFGLFTFVVNALMLYLVTVLYPKFEVSTFGAALLGVIIIGLVNFLLSDVLEQKQS